MAFDQIAAATLGAMGTFLPSVHDVRSKRPDDEKLRRDLVIGFTVGGAFSLLLAMSVASREGNPKAYGYWLFVAAALGGIYYIAFRDERDAA